MSHLVTSKLRLEGVGSIMATTKRDFGILEDHTEVAGTGAAGYLCAAGFTDDPHPPTTDIYECGSEISILAQIRLPS